MAANVEVRPSIRVDYTYLTGEAVRSKQREVVASEDDTSRGTASPSQRRKLNNVAATVSYSHQRIARPLSSAGKQVSRDVPPCFTWLVEEMTLRQYNRSGEYIRSSLFASHPSDPHQWVIYLYPNGITFL